MTLTPPDMVSPAQPPTDGRAAYIALVLVTMAAEALLVLLFAVAFGPRAGF
jgi:hypothetical protein